VINILSIRFTGISLYFIFLCQGKGARFRAWFRRN